MIQITRDNVYKILDIDINQISPKLHDVIGSVEPTYRDNVEDMREHLYSWDEVFTMANDSIPAKVYNELIQLAEVCNENEIVYIRIVKM